MATTGAIMLAYQQTVIYFQKSVIVFKEKNKEVEVDLGGIRKY